GRYLPVYISLTLAKRLDHNLIPDHLQAMGLTPRQVEELKSSPTHRFAFIFDGYDEVNTQANLYQKAGLASWPGAKLVISSRPEHLKLNTLHYRKQFAPAGDDKGARVEERWMAPFTPDQRDTYLEKYVRQGQAQAAAESRPWEGWAESKAYSDKIK